VDFQLRKGGPGQLLNVSGGQANSMSLAQLTAWCDRRFGPHQPIEDGSDRPYDVPWLILDSSKALTATAWKPDISLHQILDEIADHAVTHPDWLEWCGA
jgi:CDP-paratose 2-epimerase